VYQQFIERLRLVVAVRHRFCSSLCLLFDKTKCNQHHRGDDHDEAAGAPSCRIQANTRVAITRSAVIITGLLNVKSLVVVHKTFTG
jgi:hypothetical protein